MNGSRFRDRDALSLLEGHCTITMLYRRRAGRYLVDDGAQAGDMNSVVTEIADAGKGRSQDITWVGFNPA